jgi:hypothetical protein
MFEHFERIERFFKKQEAKEETPLQPRKYRHCKWEVILIDNSRQVVEGNEWEANGNSDTVIFRDCHGYATFMTTTSQIKYVLTVSIEIREVPEKEEV